MYPGILGSGNDIARSTGIDTIKSPESCRKKDGSKVVNKVHPNKRLADRIEIRHIPIKDLHPRRQSPSLGIARERQDAHTHSAS